jgi:hypothetical protein
MSSRVQAGQDGLPILIGAQARAPGAAVEGDRAGLSSLVRKVAILELLW